MWVKLNLGPWRQWYSCCGVDDSLSELLAMRWLQPVLSIVSVWEIAYSNLVVLFSIFGRSDGHGLWKPLY